MRRDPKASLKGVKRRGSEEHDCGEAMLFIDLHGKVGGSRFDVPEAVVVTAKVNGKKIH